MTAPAIITPDRTLDTSARGFVPLRQGNAPDANDTARVQLNRNGWAFFDDLVRPQHRQIEENVRMLAGQQHALFHPVFNRFLDVTEWMPANERAWRQRQVFNRLLPWFVITHARATENTPIVTFLPGPDRADAELAEILDIAAKSVWFEAGMEDVHDRLMGWVIVAGRAHLLSRIDPHGGKLRPWVGEDMVPVVDAYDQPILDQDQQPVFQMAQGVPFDAQGNPQAKWRMTAPGAGELVPTGKPHATPIGSLKVDVLSPMQVRGSWGPQPWHDKRVHFIKSYHSPEECYDLFGVEVPPNVRGEVSDVGELERLLYGTGFYQAHSMGGVDTSHSATNTEGYVEVIQRWEAPSRRPGMEQTDESAGGRWLVTAGNLVIQDGPRPAKLPYTSPLNTFEFIRLPGRPGGTTPQDALNPVQRSYNDGHSRLREHVNISTNPKYVIDSGSGLKAHQFTNAPGENYVLNRRPGVPAIEAVQPPRLGEEVFRMMAAMREEFFDIGFMAGANDPGHPGESGEKLKEARFNTDRFLGPTMRRAAAEYARVFANWKALLPLIWDMETTIDYAGEDNIGRTITVYPELFEEGSVNIRPDVESMLPEGRGEKQEKVYKMYMDGLFGLPGTPEALRKFWEMAHMPHLSRAAKPGGIHRTTAEQENGRLLLGEDPMAIPVFEWYDDDTHLAVHENFMASPEFLKQPKEVQDAFTLHRQAHLFNRNNKMMQAAAQAGLLNPEAGGPPAKGGPRGRKPPEGGPPVRPGLPAAPNGVATGDMPTLAGAPPAMAAG